MPGFYDGLFRCLIPEGRVRSLDSWMGWGPLFGDSPLCLLTVSPGVSLLSRTLPSVRYALSGAPFPERAGDNRAASSAPKALHTRKGWR